MSNQKFSEARSHRSQMLYNVGVLKKFTKFTGKTPVLKSLFSKVARLRIKFLTKPEFLMKTSIPDSIKNI